MSRRRCDGKAFHTRGPAAEAVVCAWNNTIFFSQTQIEAEGGQYRQ